jgi:hypothetical protein
VYRDKMLAVLNGGYALVDQQERRPLDQLTCWRIPDVRLTGLPTVAGDTLYVTNRATGEIVVLDISQIESPRLRERFTVDGNPGRVVPYGDRFFIPGGHEGVLVCER